MLQLHEKMPICNLRSKQSNDSDRTEWKKEPFRSYLGIIRFLVLATYVECAFAYKELARFNETYTHATTLGSTTLISFILKLRSQRIGTIYLCRVVVPRGLQLSGMCDSDWNGSDECLSTTGWIIFLGSIDDALEHADDEPQRLPVPLQTNFKDGFTNAKQRLMLTTACPLFPSLLCYLYTCYDSVGKLWMLD